MPRPNYWEKRYDAIYMRTISYVVRTIGRDATSLIDIGSHNNPFIEEFYWIKDRVSLDVRRPYQSATVTPVNADFFEYQPERRFDIVLCMQVIEHVQDAEQFVQKLFATGRHVIISVPYRWPPGRMKDHVHDPITERKLRAWAGVKPNFFAIVEEPFRSATGRRLVAWFDTDNRKARIDKVTLENRMLTFGFRGDEGASLVDSRTYRKRPKPKPEPKRFMARLADLFAPKRSV